MFAHLNISTSLSQVISNLYILSNRLYGSPQFQVHSEQSQPSSRTPTTVTTGSSLAASRPHREASSLHISGRWRWGPDGSSFCYTEERCRGFSRSVRWGNSYLICGDKHGRKGGKEDGYFTELYLHVTSSSPVFYTHGPEWSHELVAYLKTPPFEFSSSHDRRARK